MHFRTASAIASGIRDANEHAGRPLPVLTDLGNLRVEAAEAELEAPAQEAPAPAPTRRWVA